MPAKRNSNALFVTTVALSWIRAHRTASENTQDVQTVSPWNDTAFSFWSYANVFREKETAHLRMLHVAPEVFFREFFSQRFGRYETADLKMKSADHIVDLQHLPFEDNTSDFFYASHVLEHVPDDRKAISEIRRIL
jgi:Methyltransferase domain